MNARDRHVATWLIVLSDRIPGFVDQMLEGSVLPRDWNELADVLAGTAKLCRERGLVTIDIGDSGGR